MLTPPFVGLSIADEVALRLSQWKFDHKLMSLTLENHSYNNVMVNSLKACLRLNSGIVCDGLFM